MSLRQGLRRWAIELGVDDDLRRAVVETRLVGERLQRLLGWQPQASEAIVLAGSGRSGTTWLTDVLCSGASLQQIFEPLHPSMNSKVRQLLGWDESLHPHIRSPYLRPSVDDPEWRELLDDVMSGRVRNYWTDYERTAVFPSRYLVKMIRANLMLGFLWDNLHPTIIYVVRHPCAVVSSRVRIGWHADVRDILAQEDLIQDHLEPVVADIEREGDPLGAHAVWWAVENAVAQRELATRPHVRLDYEEIVRDPSASLAKVADFCSVKLRKPRESMIARPSRMASGARHDVGERAVSEGWQRHLSRRDQVRVLDWAHKLGVTFAQSPGFDDPSAPREAAK